MERPGRIMTEAAQAYSFSRRAFVLGAAQAGVRSSLKLLRVVKDAGLIARARELAEGILSADPDMADHPGLREAIARRVSDEDRAALAKN